MNLLRLHKKTTLSANYSYFLLMPSLSHEKTNLDAITPTGHICVTWC